MFEDRDETLTALSTTLGQLRAEFSSDQEILSMFSQPMYWSELVASRPCFLVGGRGTGKTTTLRALGYRRQARTAGFDPGSWNLVGAYWRVETNLTAAFTGPRIGDDRWIAVFSHYVNLRLCMAVLDYLAWAESEHSVRAVSPAALEPFFASLNLERQLEVSAIQRHIRVLTAELEANLNGSPQDLDRMPLSLLGRPVQLLLEAATEEVLPLGTFFAFCIDEYENLLPYQQRVVNTLIKHVGDARYTFKVGVRSTTPGERSTLARDQPLHDPADYTTVRIVDHLKEQSFQDFATAVCAKRLASGLGWHGDVAELFPALSIESEATILGVESRLEQLRHQLASEGATKAELCELSTLTPMSQYIVEYWATAQQESRLEVLKAALADPVRWRTRVGNYSYAALFTIRSGKRGTRKHYTGWSTICLLAEGNIRILLRLVHEALRIHLSSSDALAPVSPEDQTAAAVRIGETILRELQAQTVHGAGVTRLTLSLGRVFGALAAAPEGRTPEVNEFRVKFGAKQAAVGDAETLLAAAVASGALDAFDGNKEGRSTGGTKRPDYRLMPIFAPYFVYSHRKKRRLTLTSEQIASLASNNPGRTITKLLQKGSSPAPAVELPDQLLFYEDFFDEA
ncbi:ORC-CDC6 family AAA ATPase [Microbacterium sp. KHB019]|uniref:ORC-CDC6 family AAA ATPase n=1 Tax=Microbacterium sp. KHB019 TaxID=3129770 RepID=UPI00307AD4C6